MTKKSEARLARDAAKKELEKTNVWDDLNQVSFQCSELIRSHLTLMSLLSNAELVSCVVDKNMLAANATMLAKDLEQISEDFVNINNTHKHRTGRAKDPDEHMFGIQIYEKYLQLINFHEGVLTPVALHLTEQLSEAEKIMSEKQGPEVIEQNKDQFVEKYIELRNEVVEGNQQMAAAAVTDVNVITDIECREIKDDDQAGETNV